MMYTLKITRVQPQMAFKLCRELLNKYIITIKQGTLRYLKFCIGCVSWTSVLQIGQLLLLWRCFTMHDLQTAVGYEEGQHHQGSFQGEGARGCFCPPSPPPHPTLGFSLPPLEIYSVYTCMQVKLVIINNVFICYGLVFPPPPPFNFGLGVFPLLNKILK